MKTVSTVLAVGGSDSSGGAGVPADIKTITAHDLFATSVIASITIQNSQGVKTAYDLEEEVVAAQLQTILEDGKPAAVKTGMLGNEEIVECVVHLFKKFKVKNLVVDPVIRSSNGTPLLSKKGVQILKEQLLPLAKVVTPNLPEAEILSGVRIRNEKDLKNAAKAILKTGVKHVLIKGGHAKKNADDWLFDGKRSWVFESQRLDNENLHGTGCALASAIACGLAKGLAVHDAVENAKGFIHAAIRGGVQAGKGKGHVDPMARMMQVHQRFELLQGVSAALEVLKANHIGHLIPEVQSNIGVGVPDASGVNDVIAVPGRIIKLGDEIRTVAAPQFGASRHVAKIVLTAMRFDPNMRAVMNIKFSDTILNACKRLRFRIASFDRAKEPKSVKQLEGSSLEWGTYTAIERFGGVPDIIYDLGGQGKEEMIRVLAPDIGALLDKVLRIHQMALKIRPAKETDRWRKG
ncbi:bifunctional hydroxymethylpyrimidine kinase/phosphomethylpyrimidine kinase [Nitrospina gracilis]|uniref:bifunctional hydroxymethylpyrimidine kinase/phosphomethylpyrimidine kinase n=1 Tax=Nitrospina gracilis TaxID=35801 RepID=UPI001F000C90|nr:bifunctional hydroxymethylpyrimidine kinase/phosphomethylpyrimidine kinase [Nitrospina gracilis]MCF8720172.1 hydroxymethylpyrimidine/phosphomethylpyrimidine kinase [Nitrospina gracilis Nb-211]